MKFKRTLAVAALLTTGLSSAAAYADTVTFSLTTSSQSVAASTGGDITYGATVSAPASNAAAVFLNGDSFNLAAPFSLNDSDFFSNFPLSLAPGSSFTDDLFVLTVPVNVPIGTYLGTFSLLGGADGNASGTLVTVDFSLIATTPEPSSVVLLLTGMAGLTMMLLLPRFKRTSGLSSTARNNEAVIAGEARALLETFVSR